MAPFSSPLVRHAPDLAGLAGVPSPTSSPIMSLVEVSHHLSTAGQHTSSRLVDLIGGGLAVTGGVWAEVDHTGASHPGLLVALLGLLIPVLREAIVRWIAGYQLRRAVREGAHDPAPLHELASRLESATRESERLRADLDAARQLAAVQARVIEALAKGDAPTSP